MSKTTTQFLREAYESTAFKGDSAALDYLSGQCALLDHQRAEAEKLLDYFRGAHEYNEQLIAKLRTEVFDLRKRTAGAVSIIDIAGILENELDAFDIEYKDPLYCTGLDCLIPTVFDGVSVCLSVTIRDNGTARVHTSTGMYDERTQNQIPVESLADTIRQVVAAYSKDRS